MAQNIIVYVLILLALTNAGFHLVKSFTGKKTGNCGTCPDCGIKKQFGAGNKHLKLMDRAH
jgi:hypothetical protein